jgi:fission process protein 1
MHTKSSKLITWTYRAGETTDSSVRYAGYAGRVRTILLAAHRYVAYTSDIGESFRPVAHPGLIRAAYGISWAYIGGDVAHEGYKAYVRNQKILHPEKRTLEDEVQLEMKGKVPVAIIKEGKGFAGKEEALSGRVAAIDDYRAVMAQRAVFQSLASMGLPAFTIHSIVRYSGRALKNVKNVRVRTWGPIGVCSSFSPSSPSSSFSQVERGAYTNICVE